ncbi:hypothetical protein [Mycobacterium sp. 3519A]|uniref:hypothetical protein n=1 Tax=Mycobacterium sp. 3519A TaxID=2057184 RepID=UPI000C7A14F3|nr:hypothetical protein [Mycobacterium sp. 3519A]
MNPEQLALRAAEVATAGAKAAGRIVRRVREVVQQAADRVGLPLPGQEDSGSSASAPAKKRPGKAD